MAYASKYYDPVKRHEYYEKHKKLKGRRKRGSVASLNDEGKVAAAEVKERLKEELKAALKKLPRGSKEARQKLREEFNEKYYAELDKIKRDASFAKAKREKAAKTPREKAQRQPAERTQRAATKAKTTAKKVKKQSAAGQAMDALDKISKLVSTSDGLSEDQKLGMKPQIYGMIDKITAKLDKALDAEKRKKGQGKELSADEAIDAMATMQALAEKYDNLPDEVKSKVQGEIQVIIDRIAKKLGIATTKLSERDKTEEEAESKEESEATTGSTEEVKTESEDEADEVRAKALAEADKADDLRRRSARKRKKKAGKV